MGGAEQALVEQQDRNTAKLVLGAFFRVATNRGVTPEDITNYLQDKFGDVWRTSVLTAKAEEALTMGVALGFVYKEGDKYVADVARQKKVAQSSNNRRRSGGSGVNKRRPRSYYS